MTALWTAQLRSPIRRHGQTCERCTTPLDDSRSFSTCFDCGQMTDAASRIGLILWAPKPDQIYRDLQEYKTTSVANTAARQRLRQLLHDAFRLHSPCIRGNAQPGSTAIAVVPSTRPERQGQPHPLQSLLDFFPPSQVFLAPQYSPDSSRTTGERRQYRPEDWKVQPDGETVPSHVLVVDDSWVRGGHAQSLAGAYRRAGATQVTVLCIGRVLDPDNWAPTERLLASGEPLAYAPERCLFPPAEARCTT